MSVLGPKAEFLSFARPRQLLHAYPGSEFTKLGKNASGYPTTQRELKCLYTILPIIGHLKNKGLFWSNYRKVNWAMRCMPYFAVIATIFRRLVFFGLMCGSRCLGFGTYLIRTFFIARLRE
jgi:hypothetical protein